MNFPFSPRLLICAVCLIAAPLAHAQNADALPDNITRSLRELTVWHQAQSRSLTTTQRRAKLAAEMPAIAKTARIDAADGRALVDAYLDGAQPLAAVRKSLEDLGATVTAQFAPKSGIRGSILTLRLPLERTVEAARTPGVLSLQLVLRPIRRVGKTTSQGAGVLKTGVVNLLGYDGKGITVGVLSDSFDKVTPHAAADILSGDLPGPGNPNGRTQPVYILKESGELTDNADEGRAMLQIIHDLAPGASLAFGSVVESQAAYADVVRRMRTDPAAHCDILVDDISFPNEPFFSDGPIAQAVNDVVHSNTLPGRRVLYYSAAGNDGPYGFDSVFRKISNAAARNMALSVQLDRVPLELTSGGFQNFDERPGKVDLVQKITVRGGDATINIQWDDPFPPGFVTTDYNVLVFNEAGVYQPDLSGTDDNFSLGTPFEFIDLPVGRGGADTVYQLVIARRGGGAPAATHLRYLGNTSGDLQIEYAAYNPPTIFGHSGAPGCDAVAAYDYADLSKPEDFTSAGPTTVYFDLSGKRLAEPEVRPQPTIAAPDNVNTTFFPNDNSDTDGDGFPNFSGTSAAAPHAAAVAALVMQAAGGSGKLDDVQMREILQSTARPHDLDPAFSKAVFPDADDASTITLTATGDAGNNSALSKQFFQLSLDGGPATRRLRKVIIDLAPVQLKFDSDPDSGRALIFNKAVGFDKTQVKGTFNGDNTQLTLQFEKTAFAPGSSLRFGVDRDLLNSSEGNSADLLAGAVITTRTLDDDGATKRKATGTFANDIGNGFTTLDGFGLIDAEAAVRKVLGGNTSAKP